MAGRAPEMMAAVPEALSQTCSRVSLLVGHAAGGCRGPEVSLGSPASAHHLTGSEDLILVSTNTQGTSGCQMKVCVQPSKHTPPQNSPDPLINWSW